MSRIGSRVIANVGTFFGIAKEDSSSIDKWKRKAEKKVKNKDFGLSMKRSFHSRKARNDDKFASDATRVLSQIEAIQRLEDEESHCEKENDRETKSVTFDDQPKEIGAHFSEDDLKPGPSEQDKTTKLSDVTISAIEDVKTNFVSFVYNEIYCEEDIEPDNTAQLEYKGSSPEITKKMIKTCMANTETSGPYYVEDRHAKSNVIFFDEEQVITQSPELTKDKGLQERYTGGPDLITNTNKCVISHVDEKDGVQKTDSEEEKVKDDFSEKGNADTYTENSKEKETLTKENLVWGKDALIHYSFYVQVEKKLEKKTLLKELAEKMSEYNWKIKAIDDLIEMARDYYLNPKSNNASKWKDLKRKVRRSSSHKLGRTEVRRKLDTLPEYRPYFTWFIILAQIISVVVTCSLGGFTYIGLEPRLSLEKGVKTFMGTETIHKWSAPNIWLGPAQKYLISIGATFAPCMRNDVEVQVMYSIQNFSDHSPLGCCEIKSRNVAGTTTEAECSHLSEGIAAWKSDTTCANRPASESSVRHLLRPCCLGLKGQCRLLSHKHCTFLEGSFHQFGAEHCSQVNCLNGVCGLGDLASSPEQPWLPEAPYQWWRFPLSLLYHNGIIHVAMVTLAQWILWTQIEHTAGWLRMIIIYLLSGIGALLTSAVFTPYHSHVGSVGAVFGMVGVVLVELIQFWSLVQSPLKELAKLLGAIVIFLFCGTLPYLDVFGMFSGFLIGILTGIVVLPYITFGKWQTRTRLILTGIGIPLLIIIFAILIQMFLNVQSVHNCSVCQSLNCIPYTENMCKTSLWQQF